MSVTFSVAKEEVVEVKGEPVIRYRSVYPAGFDATPVIDLDFPEYGPITPENPNDVNLSNDHAFMVLRLLGYVFLDSVGRQESSGLITDTEEFIFSCDSVLGTVHSYAEMDAGTETKAGDGHATVIHCGLAEGYLERTVGRLRALATVAMENEAIISFA